MLPSRVTRRGIALTAIFAASLAIGRGEATGRQAASPASGGPADPLVALNNQFHDAYRQARIARLAEAGPVVVIGFQSLALVRGKEKTEVPFPPASYERLKEVAHVPLLTFVLLEPTKGSPLNAVERARVGFIRDLVEASLGSLDRAGFAPEVVERQRQILGLVRAYLVSVLEAGQASSESLTTFARQAGPLMLANADDAAAAHLNALNAQMEAWRKELTPDEWRTMHVVVMSAHMARDREIAMQYFGKLLDQPTEGRRLIYAEGLSDESKALDLLGTHLLDGAASAAFFGDPMRLHRDLLSDGATRALQTMTIRP